MASPKTKIEIRQFKDVNIWMLAGKPKNVPEVLQGVFFMDGNPAPEDCFTFHGSRWDAGDRTLTVPVFGVRQWTFQLSGAGRFWLRLVRFLRAHCILSFHDEALEHAVVVFSLRGLRVPRWLIEFKLDRAVGIPDGGTWDREHTCLFRQISLGRYTLKRVADGDGEVTPAFEEMLGKVADTCLAIAEADSDN